MHRLTLVFRAEGHVVVPSLPGNTGRCSGSSLPLTGQTLGFQRRRGPLGSATSYRTGGNQGLRTPHRGC